MFVSRLRNNRGFCQRPIFLHSCTSRRLQMFPQHRPSSVLRARVLQRLGSKDSPVLHLLKTALCEAQLERCNLRLEGCRCLSLCKLGEADSHRWFKERQITADTNNRIERWGKYVRAQINSEPAFAIAKGDGGWVSGMSRGDRCLGRTHHYT